MKKILKFIGIAFIAIIVLGVVFGDSDSNAADNRSTSSSTNSNAVEEVAPTEEPKELIVVDVDDMIDLLDENALKAEKTYQDAYLQITGKLSNIDSDGKYISLSPMKDEWSFDSIQCYIGDDGQLDKVMEMKTDDIVTLTGTIRDIGEVMGYSLDIESID